MSQSKNNHQELTLYIVKMIKSCVKEAYRYGDMSPQVDKAIKRLANDEEVFSFLHKIFVANKDEEALRNAVRRHVDNFKNSGNKINIDDVPSCESLLKECRDLLVTCTLLDKSGQCADMVEKLEKHFKQ